MTFRYEKINNGDYEVIMEANTLVGRVNYPKSKERRFALCTHENDADIICQALNSMLAYETLKVENKKLREALYPHDAIKDCYPLILYFDSRGDAYEFLSIVQEAKPGMRSYRI